MCGSLTLDFLIEDDEKLFYRCSVCRKEVQIYKNRYSINELKKIRKSSNAKV